MEAHGEPFAQAGALPGAVIHHVADDEHQGQEGHAGSGVHEHTEPAGKGGEGAPDEVQLGRVDAGTQADAPVDAAEKRHHDAAVAGQRRSDEAVQFVMHQPHQQGHDHHRDGSQIGDGADEGTAVFRKHAVRTRNARKGTNGMQRADTPTGNTKITSAN